MSVAKAKCSNCGAELTNLTFGWGKSQWVWGLLGFLPLIGFVVWLELTMFRPNRSFVDDIKAVLIETRSAKDRFDVLGRVTNNGSRTWNRVMVEAEIYGGEGKFLDEASDYVAVTLPPGAEEHFRLTIKNQEGTSLEGAPNVVLKVIDADEDRF